MSVMPVSALWRWVTSSRVLLFTAGSLLGTQAVTSGLGFIYWWLAAQHFQPTDVGVAAASVSAMQLLGNVGVLGLSTSLVSELPRYPGREGSLITTAVLVAGIVGGALGILFALMAPHISTNLRPLADSIESVTLFAVAVGATTVGLVLDMAVLGLLRGELQLWRNTLFAVTKLGALIVVGIRGATHPGMAILATWVTGNLISLMALVALGTWKRGWTNAWRPQWSLLRNVSRIAIGHHTLNLAIVGPSIMLPLIATTLLSAAMTAYFYAAWMITTVVCMVPFVLSSTLFAVGSRAPKELPGRLRITLGLALVEGVLANIVLLIGADHILRVFGHAYADQASWSLRVLGLGVFAYAIKDHYASIARVYQRVGRAALLVTLGSLLELILAAIGASHGGVLGLSLGWLAGVCIEGVCMAPTVYKAAALPTMLGRARPHRSDRSGRATASPPEAGR